MDEVEDALADGKVAEVVTLEAMVMADLADVVVIILSMVSISLMSLILSVLRNGNNLDIKAETMCSMNMTDLPAAVEEVTPVT